MARIYFGVVLDVCEPRINATRRGRRQKLRLRDFRGTLQRSERV
jgi:hypothetical protein